MRVQKDCKRQRTRKSAVRFLSPRNDKEVSPIKPQQYGYLKNRIEYESNSMIPIPTWKREILLDPVLNKELQITKE